MTGLRGDTFSSEYGDALDKGPGNAIHDEIYKLRQVDSNHFPPYKHQPEMDLRSIYWELHQKHQLPQLHIINYGSPQVEAPSNAVAGQLSTLGPAVERARAGGRPLAVVQIGDSHIVPGTETAALASRLGADLGLQSRQVRYSADGKGGKTAPYANQHPDEFLKDINRDTDLVVVSFGSNEAAAQVGTKYAADYAHLIERIRQKAPQAAIVMVGPTDGNVWNTNNHLAGLRSVTAEQMSVASSVPNSVYVDVGPEFGTVASLRSTGLMQSDNLHLTTQGYKQLGALIADNISSRLTPPRSNQGFASS